MSNIVYSITAANAEPVTLQEACDWLKLNKGDDDDVVRALISAAREYAESATSRQLLSKTVTEYWDCFPILYAGRNNYNYRVMYLGAMPLASSSLTLSYLATTGGSYTTFDASNYDVDIVSTPARIVLHSNAAWPNAVLEANAVKAVYTVGSATPTDVAASIKVAMRLLIGFWYENREDMAIKAGVRSADALLSKCRVSF